MRIIAGTARSRTIEAPPGKDTRPTLDRVRENLFNILQHRVYGAKVLDLFAGSGALSLEAVSRGASLAVMVDHDRAANACERANTEKLGFQDRTKILKCDWQAAVRQLQADHAQFDLVFLDPPYAMQDLTDVTEQLKSMLAENGMVVIEHQADHPSLVADGYALQDSRRYGYAGISMYTLDA